VNNAKCLHPDLGSANQLILEVIFVLCCHNLTEVCTGTPQFANIQLTNFRHANRPASMSSKKRQIITSETEADIIKCFERDKKMVNVA
jgi:hypothetical protein